MYRLVAAICAALMVFAACGDSSGGGGDPGSAESCDDLVDAGIDLIQDVLDELSDLDLSDIEALGDEPPEALDDLETRGEELQTRADELGCTDEELQQGLIDNIDQLEADGPFAELILQGLRDDPTIFE